MQVTPRSEKEINEMNLWPEDEYDFEITGAEEKVSSSGNEMIMLEVKCFKGDRSRFITDFLLNTETMAFKLRHFAEAVGLLDKYEAGTLADYDCKGRTGRAKVGVQKDKAGTYPDKNVIRDYIVDRPKAGERPQAPIDAQLDDEIPF